MSVLIDTERKRYTPSGLQFFCDNLLRGLSELAPGDISIYGPREAYGFPVEKFSPLHKFYNPIPKRYDIVHITHQNQSYFPQKFGEQRVLTVHDLNYLHVSQTDARTREKFIKQVACNIEMADVIVCISEFTKDDLLSREELFPGLSGKPVHVIYNGLDTHPTLTEEAIDRNLPEELKGKDFILNIGVANPKKNQQVIIEAMPLMDSDVVLVVNDPENAYARFLKRRADDMNVADRLHIYARIPEEVKYALISRSTAMVYPSLIEGFGYPPVEAMVCGTPVILSRNGSLPEIGGDAAVYLKDTTPWEVDKAVRSLKIRTQDKGRIKAQAEKFSYRAMAANYLDLYRSLR